MSVRTSAALVSPVTAADLAEYLGVDPADPLISGVLLAATDAAIRYLQYDLNPRAWVLTLWDWPHEGTRHGRSVSRQNYYLQREIQLPYAAIQSVETVTTYGTAVALADVIIREDSIILPLEIISERYKYNESPAIVVNYTAGLNPIPEAVNQAILMTGAYLYEHRGECDADGGLARSGGRMLLQPHARYGVTF